MAHDYIKIEVSLAALSANLAAVRGRIDVSGGGRCRLCAVVKADAYGHGLAGVWPTMAAGADMLAVATIPEALRLRALGYAGELLTTMAVSPRLWPAGKALITDAVAADVQVVATDIRDIDMLADLAAAAGRAGRIHVKVDTGMGRSGVNPDDAAALIERVRSASALRLAGVCTHFAAADDVDKSHALGQLELFCRVLADSGLDGDDTGGVLRHAAASAALADLPAARLDMVRAGLALYGYNSEGLVDPPDLRPALRVLVPVIQVRPMRAGQTCGYGCTHRLARESLVGIVPMGYADGLARGLSGRMSVQIAGRDAAVLGRISMDQIIVDLTDIPDAGEGAMVEVISADPAAVNSVDNLARLAGTISYEITSRLNPWRAEFRYVDDFPD